MCAIAGIIAFDGRVSPQMLHAMAIRQAHRGPDGSGEWISKDGRVGFAHRHLAILDLTDRAAQPMSNRDGTVHLVYNGEIYNFRELRRELEKGGCEFISDSDTEVLLHGYEAWGPAVVSRLRGMFAFAIWDEPKRRLVLAKDRLGVKPLYYARDSKTFSFASELKGIEAGPLENRALDPGAIYDFLTYLYVPTPKTPYRAVRKLPPASILILEQGIERIETYWDARFDGSRRGREEDLVLELRSKLEDAVKSHLVSDVPVGILLSGGLDSSTVAAFAGRGAKTFSVGFDRGRSEIGFARRIAERFGAAHAEAVLRTADVPTDLQRMIAWYDEPHYDTSAFPTSLVCRTARRDVKVALSGDGGDEVFGGYAHYAKFAGLDRRNPIPAGIGKAALRMGEGILKRALRGVERYAFLLGGMTRVEKEVRLPPEVNSRFADYDDYWLFRRYWREDLDTLSRLQYLDLKTYLPDDILTKMDRVGMETSLEVRVPLLDTPLVEFVCAIPSEQRAPEGPPKHLLRKAMAGLLPPETLSRKKRGFSVPSETWLGDSASHRGWRRPHRVAWRILDLWAAKKTGSDGALEILRSGP
ncbi:MAG TPA: asparagine synthase (glutamine-hydrolyzing) [Planctomycetota bacterium]|nr:asparagine synthase (glutamine-hydrolyzing) [Planctomycetota bacterium]